MDSATISENPYSDLFQNSEQLARAATPAARGRPKSPKAPPQVQVDIPRGMSPIPLSSQSAAGGGSSRASTQHPIEAQDNEDQVKPRNTRGIKEHDSLFEQFPKQRERMIT